MSYAIEQKLQKEAYGWSKSNLKQKETTQVVPLEFAIQLVREFSSRSITWDVFDFETRAREKESSESGEDFDDLDIEVPEEFKLYDRTKFQEILIYMIRKHDCNNGITWDDIDYYLDRFCEKSKKISTNKRSRI